MTHIDQIRFQILKLDRAIKTVGDLPTKPSRAGFLAELKADRTALRQLLGTGRRSCGECGHPTRLYLPIASRPQTFHMCATEGCGQRGRAIDNN